MHNGIKGRRVIAFAAAMTVAGSLTSISRAAVKEWDGGTSGSNQTWTTTTNWVGDTLPATGDELVIATRSGTDPTRVIGTATLGSATGSMFLASGSSTTTFFGAARPSIASLTFGTDTVSLLPATLSVLCHGTTATPANETMRVTGGSDGTFFALKNAVTGTVRIDQSNAGTLSVVLGAAGAAAGTGIFNISNSTAVLEMEAGMSGSAGVVKQGLGTLYISTSATTTQSYTGGVNVQSGTLRIASGGSLGSTLNVVNVGDATLQIDGGGIIASSRSINLNAATSKILVTSGTGTVSGGFGGTGGLTKLGTGTFYVNGANTFTGDTTVSAGFYRENGTHTNAGSYNVGASATYGGIGTISLQSGAAMNIAGILSPGDSASAVGTFTVNGNVNLASAGVFGRLAIDADQNTAQKADMLTVNGALDLSGATLTLTGTPNIDGTPTIFATYGSRIGSFGTTTIPAGYSLAYDFGSSGNQLALIRDAASSLYFTGSQNAVLNTSSGGLSNFTTDAAGTVNTGAIPTAATDVFFAANANTNAGNFATTLGANLFVNSLTFGTGENAATPVSLTGNTLTVVGGSGTYGTGVGLRVLGGAGAVSIGSAVTVGSSQTWTNDSSNPVTVTGTVGTGTSTLTLAGTSAYTFSASLSGKIANNVTAITMANTAAATISAAISGTGDLVLNNSALVTLTGANTYTGKTIISGTANVSVGSGGQFGTGEIVNGTLINFINDTVPVLVPSVISGTGSINKSGSSTVTFTGANTYTGTTTLAAGTLIIGDGGRFGTGTVTNNATVSFANTGPVAIANAIGGTGALTQTGTGTTVLTGANTYTGATTVSAGTLALGDGGQFGTAAVTNNATVGFANAAPLAVASVINGTGGVTQTGTGITTLTAANTYTGATTVAAGTLKATSVAYAVPLTSTGGIDVKSGKFLFDYTGTTSPVATVKTILDGGYAGAFATGQIRSTGLAAGRTLGYGDNGLDTVTVRVTLPGDADLDGDVDFNDFLSLQTNFGSTGTRFDQGNFNYDAATDFNDFLALQTNFGQSVGGGAVAFTGEEVAAITAFGLTAAVPEPASLALLGLAAAAGLRRRRA